MAYFQYLKPFYCQFPKYVLFEKVLPIYEFIPLLTGNFLEFFKDNIRCTYCLNAKFSSRSVPYIHDKLCQIFGKLFSLENNWIMKKLREKNGEHKIKEQEIP